MNVDVRVVSATSRDLEVEIREKRFREDLFYRLNVVPVILPPLNQRREDIPVLVEHYAARFAADQRLHPPEISDEAMAALQACDWPGNVRQLRNVIERTIILAPKDKFTKIEVDMLPPEILGHDDDLDQGVASLMGWRRARSRTPSDTGGYAVVVNALISYMGVTNPFIWKKSSYKS